jgi:hypothetical protein
MAHDAMVVTALTNSTLHYTKLPRFAKYKHVSLLGPIVSYKEN